jgi:lipocalin
MVAFSKIKPGETLYDCHMTRMGNTTLRKMGTWTVKVLEVYPEKQAALVSWNGNRAEVWGLSRMQKLRRSQPSRT